MIESNDVFISYCWRNSHQAQKLGQSREEPQCLGQVDPRQIKDQLQLKGYNVWLDIEQAGQVYYILFLYFVILDFFN